MLKASYEFDTKKLYSTGDEVNVSLPEAIELAKNLLRCSDGFLVLEDEHGDILQFSYGQGSMVVDVPIAENEHSLRAVFSIEDYLNIIDGLCEPLKDHIKTLTLETVSWDTEENVNWNAETTSWNTEKTRNSRKNSSDIESEKDVKFHQWSRKLDEELEREHNEYIERIKKMSPDEKFDHYKERYGEGFISHHSYLHGEDFTPELLAYEDKVESLLDELIPARQALSIARRSKNDDAALAAAQTIFSTWVALSPIKKYAIDHFNADYYVNRISVIQMRQGCPEETIVTISTYYESPFYVSSDQRRKGHHQAIQKRLVRAQKMVDQASRK